MHTRLVVREHETRDRDQFRRLGELRVACGLGAPTAHARNGMLSAVECTKWYPGVFREEVGTTIETASHGTSGETDGHVRSAYDHRYRIRSIIWYQNVLRPKPRRRRGITLSNC